MEEVRFAAEYIEFIDQIEGMSSAPHTDDNQSDDEETVDCTDVTILQDKLKTARYVIHIKC